MALKDLPGTEVFAVSPDGKRSRFGLFLYLPEEREKGNYPQIGMAVIKSMADGSWAPWMVQRSESQVKTGKYNPRVFVYMDAIPSLVRALQELHKKHTPGAKAEDASDMMRRSLEEQKRDDELDQAVRSFGEFK